MGERIKIEEEMKKMRDEMIKKYINSELIFEYVKELEENNKELEEKNTELKEQFKKAIEYRQALEKDLFENCSNYVISKDKIREKLNYQYKQKEYSQDIVNILEELLEE